MKILNDSYLAHISAAASPPTDACYNALNNLGVGAMETFATSAKKCKDAACMHSAARTALTAIKVQATNDISTCK